MFYMLRLADNEKLTMFESTVTGWDTMVDDALKSEMSAFKQDLLGRLVDTLRANRSHWHPQV
jgi:hypothetical protein